MSLEGACGGITIDICAGGSSNTFSNSASVSFSVINSVVMASVIPGGVDHNSLANLTVGNPHTQYALISSLATVATTGAYSDLTGKPTLVTAHSALSGLTIGDDHTQYALLAGRAGGQSLNGGTAANDDLILQGTTDSNRTSSYVIMQPNGGGVAIGASIALDDLYLSTSSPNRGFTAKGIHPVFTFNDTDSAYGASVQFRRAGNLQWYFQQDGQNGSGSGNFWLIRNIGSALLAVNCSIALGGGGDEASFNTTANQTLQIFNGIPPVSSIANGAILYAKDFVAGDSRYYIRSEKSANLVSLGDGKIQVTAGDSSTFAGCGGSIFDHYADAGNSTTAETDLYSDTIAASSLATNGDKLKAEYGGIFVSSATATREIKIYFAGTVIFDTGALTLSLSSAWTAYITIIRVSSSVVRYMISFTTEGAALAAYTAVGELTGLTLSNTNILKITGQAAGVGAATNDIVAKLGSISWYPAA